MSALLLSLNLLRILDTSAPTESGRPQFVTAASGLLKVQDYFYVVADDELSLAQFRLDPKVKGHYLEVFTGEKLPLKKKERKKAKADWEALCLFSHSTLGPNPHLLILPSGSEKNRSRGAWIALDSKGNWKNKPQMVDFAPLYQELEKSFEELNIEGAVMAQGVLKLFQRGNGAAGKNAVIDLDLKGVLEDLKNKKALQAKNILRHHSFDLGNVKGTRLSFTDAALNEKGEIYFLAAAEAKDSTFHDGEFRGAILGKISSSNIWEKISDIKIDTKPEGLWIDKEDFYVVTDADDHDVAAKLYRGELKAP